MAVEQTPLVGLGEQLLPSDPGLHHPHMQRWVHGQPGMTGSGDEPGMRIRHQGGLGGVGGADRPRLSLTRHQQGRAGGTEPCLGRNRLRSLASAKARRKAVGETARRSAPKRSRPAGSSRSPPSHRYSRPITSLRWINGAVRANASFHSPSRGRKTAGQRLDYVDVLALWQSLSSEKFRGSCSRADEQPLVPIGHGWPVRACLVEAAEFSAGPWRGRPRRSGPRSAPLRS
jgi:hypothetical protein